MLPGPSPRLRSTCIIIRVHENYAQKIEHMHKKTVKKKFGGKKVQELNRNENASIHQFKPTILRK